MILVRRAITVGLLLLGMLGLAPLVPLVFGYASASVQQLQGATASPPAGETTAQYVVCAPPGDPWLAKAGLSPNTQSAAVYCYNYWHSALDITIGRHSQGSSRVLSFSAPRTTVPVGGPHCITATYSTSNGNDSNAWFALVVTAEGAWADFTTYTKVRVSSHPSNNALTCSAQP